MSQAKVIDTDSQGYLRDAFEWTTEVGGQLAAQEGLFLTQEHWTVILTIRNFYLEHGVLPPLRGLIRLLADKIPPEKNTSLYLQALFPQGLMRQASKLAGLPKPVRCI